MRPETRLIEAVAMLILRKVEEELPPTYQKRSDAKAIANHMVKPMVVDNLNGMIVEIVEEICTKLTPMVPVRSRLSGRWQILDNRDPCTVCGDPLSRVAWVTLNEGRVEQVECENCTRSEA